MTGLLLPLLLAVLGAPAGAAARSLPDLSLAAYGPGTRDQQLAQALTCLGAVRTKLMTAPPPPPPRPGAPPPPPRPAPFGNDGNVANCLRYAFHDCPFDKDSPDGTPGGCNGALRTTIAGMIAKGNFNTPNADFPQDNGLDTCQALLVGNDGVSGVCGAVRSGVAGCASMPFADCISFAGILAVAAKGGTPPGGCPWTPGRIDYVGNHAANLLPSEFGNATATIATFARYGMPVSAVGLTLERTVTLLLGAHTLGRSRQTAESACSRGINAMTATPGVFDTDYYSRMIASVNRVDNVGGGWFCSDMTTVCATITYNRPRAGVTTLRQALCAGRTDSPLYPHVNALANGGNAAFFDGFCKAYQAMSLIGYNVPPTYAADAAKFASLLAPATPQ